MRFQVLASIAFFGLSAFIGVDAAVIKRTEPEIEGIPSPVLVQEVTEYDAILNDNPTEEDAAEIIDTLQPAYLEEAATYVALAEAEESTTE